MRQLLLDLFGDTAQPLDTPANQGEQRAPQHSNPKHGAHDRWDSPPPAPTHAPPRFTHPRANRAIVLDGAHIAYHLRRGQRRTIGFTVDTGGLTVSAPRWSAPAEIDAALREKQRWIVTKLNQARQRHERLQAMRIVWQEGASVPFLGQPVILHLDARQRHGPGGAVLTSANPSPGVPCLTLRLGLPHSASPEQLREATQAWLMRQARRVFTARLDHFAPQLGVRWQRLGLSSAGTRWGSASADGAIRLNWRLIHLREPVIDYVVVHELAHLHEMNHGPRFWQHVQAVLPDYADRRNELRNQSASNW
ncbi:MAG: M48 family metallopeptidase [Burkholderiaceae bacterium]|jgi:predicted metal-dependent hydrolase|nr:M48 family metallopeptidase [Burkholderiaceae bacterium]